MTRQEKIAVFEAWLDGKQIQSRPINIRCDLEDDPWRDHLGALQLDFELIEYRVKPTPREWWILPPENNNKPAVCDYKPPNPDCIHVREILE